jgi:hypothetical protein
MATNDRVTRVSLQPILGSSPARVTGARVQPVLGSSAVRLTGVRVQLIVPPPPPVRVVAGLTNAAGPFRWRSRVSIRDLYNGVKGTFISPTNNWQASDFPPYAQDSTHGYASGSPIYPLGDANLASDGGDRRWLDIQLPFTISVSAAQRLAKIELMRRRQQGTGTFIYNMALYQASALDVIQMTLPIFNWVNKLLEITAFRFRAESAQGGGSDAPTVIGTEIDVQETDPSVYDWSTSEELTPAGYQQSGITNIATLDNLYTVNGS